MKSNYKLGTKILNVLPIAIKALEMILFLSLFFFCFMQICRQSG